MAKYSDARNVQLVIALLKKYGIRNVIASPGTTNVPFVYSVQNDSFFRVLTAFDERSAAYMACGLAGESRSEERRVGKECRSRWSPYH